MGSVDQEGMSEEERLEWFHQLLEATVEFLNVDEMEVLLEIAQGIVRGQNVYGGMNLDEDTRDLLGEADEEERDWFVYRAMQFVRERRRRKQ